MWGEQEPPPFRPWFGIGTAPYSTDGSRRRGAATRGGTGVPTGGPQPPPSRVQLVRRPASDPPAGCRRNGPNARRGDDAGVRHGSGGDAGYSRDGCRHGWWCGTGSARDAPLQQTTETCGPASAAAATCCRYSIVCASRLWFSFSSEFLLLCRHAQPKRRSRD